MDAGQASQIPPSMPPRPPAFTHFLCLKLVTPTSRPQLSCSLAAFKADVTSPASFGVPADAVRPLGTLHLTLGMMSLPRDEERKRATALLQSLKPREILASVKPVSSRQLPAARGNAPAAPPTQVSLTLRGLHSMQQASKASVLYAPPHDPDGILQRFCESLRDVFLDADLMTKDARPLLLHATIVNTIYVKQGHRGKGGRGKGHKGRLVIDATEILDRYDEFLWMEEVLLEKIAICRMGAKPVDGEDEAAYEVEAEVDF